MSDDELLEAVNNDLSREVPLALAPVSAITDRAQPNRRRIRRSRRQLQATLSKNKEKNK